MGVAPQCGPTFFPYRNQSSSRCVASALTYTLTVWVSKREFLDKSTNMIIATYKLVCIRRRKRGTRTTWAMVRAARRWLNCAPMIVCAKPSWPPWKRTARRISWTLSNDQKTSTYTPNCSAWKTVCSRPLSKRNDPNWESSSSRKFRLCTRLLTKNNHAPLWIYPFAIKYR